MQVATLTGFEPAFRDSRRCAKTAQTIVFTGGSRQLRHFGPSLFSRIFAHFDCPNLSEILTFD